MASLLAGVVPFEGQYDFYGVDMNRFKPGDVVLEAVEDESDGYRSYLDSVISEVNPDAKGFYRFRLLGFNSWGLTRIFEAVDVVDGHEWLSVGTHDADDYYPSFRFSYSPKKPTVN